MIEFSTNDPGRPSQPDWSPLISSPVKTWCGVLERWVEDAVRRTDAGQAVTRYWLDLGWERAFCRPKWRRGVVEVEPGGVSWYEPPDPDYDPEFWEPVGMNFHDLVSHFADNQAGLTVVLAGVLSRTEVFAGARA